MYTMDPDKLPRKPVVKSLTSANQELQDWITANDYQHFPDCDGQVWLMDLKSQLMPDPKNRHGQIWRMECVMSTVLDEGFFSEEAGYTPEGALRLREFIGDQKVQITMRPRILEADSIEGARNLLAEEVKKLRKNMKLPAIRQIKKDLMGRWIEEHQLFGMHPFRP